jgi:hypothetical protein
VRASPSCSAHSRSRPVTSHASACCSRSSAIANTSLVIFIGFGLPPRLLRSLGLIAVVPRPRREDGQLFPPDADRRRRVDPELDLPAAYGQHRDDHAVADHDALTDVTA